MEIGEWLRRYALQIQRVSPSTTDAAAIHLAIAGLGGLVDAEVKTEMTPEDHADSDVTRIHCSEH